MDVKSVTSSASTSAGSSAQATQAQQSQQTQQIEKRQPAAEERAESKEAAPRPVVNSDGQKTGTVINVTA